MCVCVNVCFESQHILMSIQNYCHKIAAQNHLMYIATDHLILCSTPHCHHTLSSLSHSCSHKDQWFIEWNGIERSLVVHVKWFSTTIKYFLCVCICLMHRATNIRLNNKQKASQVLKTLANICNAFSPKITTASKRKMENWKTKALMHLCKLVLFTYNQIFIQWMSDLFRGFSLLSRPKHSSTHSHLCFLTITQNRSNTHATKYGSSSTHSTHTLNYRIQIHSPMPALTTIQMIESVGKVSGGGGGDDGWMLCNNCAT